jgi:UDPglucose--hexose-1-phosphate uridylyltransferase
VSLPVIRRSLFGRTESIVSPSRSERPPGSSAGRDDGQAFCPFCEGHESETEREVFALRVPTSRSDQPGWLVRVVPNKYPALRWPLPAVSSADLLQKTSARGFHEVVIETPQHDRRLARASVADIETLLGIYQARVRVLSQQPDIASVVVLRNEGRAAGASQEHPHSQILALPVITARMQDELQVLRQHYEAHGRCLSCAFLERERADRQRVICESGAFTALASFAPRFPYETWLLPRSHQHDFRNVAGVELRELAAMLKQILAALEAVAGECSYNLVLQTAPVIDVPLAAKSFHWRLEIIPRLTTPSGFELGCDMFIVALAPEQAAVTLRRALT